MPTQYYGYHCYYNFFYSYHYHYYLCLSNDYSRTGIYHNLIYLITRAEAKNFQYIILNGYILPENMGMDMMILKV